MTDYFTSSLTNTPIKSAIAGPSTPRSSALTPGGRHTQALASPARPTHRLLYRGALSLSDSHILLDGITFVASSIIASSIGGTSSAHDNRHDGAPPTPGHGLKDLLDNPLPLALESMRGRPSLRLLGETRLDSLSPKLWLDERGQVTLYIHPDATLTNTYFTNILCTLALEPDPDHMSKPDCQRTQYGIRIALGDDDSDSSTTSCLIFGRTIPVAHGSNDTYLRLVVARLSNTPPPIPTPAAQIPDTPGARRMPRPDDPTPRKPPLLYFGNKRPRTESPEIDDLRAVQAVEGPGPKRPRMPPRSNGTLGTASSGSSSIHKLKVKTKDPVKDKEKEAEADRTRRAREVMLGLHRKSSGDSAASVSASSKSSSARRASSSAADPFKIPAVPVTNGRKGKEKERPTPSPSPAPTPTSASASASVSPAAGHYEEVNKLMVKRSAVIALAARGVLKNSHPEFAELYAHVYRGAAFALRASMRSRMLEGPKDMQEVDNAVNAHVEMYLLSPEG